MFTIRFPSGVSVIYNDAFYMKKTTQAFELYTRDPDEGGRWIASIPVSTDCIIEARPVCRVENSATAPTLYAAADRVLENLHELNYHRLKVLKSALKSFNARAGNWNVDT